MTVTAVGKGTLPPPTDCGQLSHHYSLPMITCLLLEVSIASEFIFLPRLQVNLQHMVLWNDCDVVYQPASHRCQQPNVRLYMCTDLGGTCTCICTKKKDTNPSMLTEQEPKLNTILEF